MRSSVCLATFLLGCVLVVGCDSSHATINGSVIFDDAVVEKGAITFFPIDGKSPSAGGPIEGGKFSVKLTAGEMKVVISGAKGTGKTKKLYNTANSPVMEITEELLPPRYSDPMKSQVKHTIPPGTSEKVFTLSSKDP